jgi:hypothetical protein
MLCFADCDYEKIKTRDYKEYNKIQNLFLEEKNIEKLVRRTGHFPKNSYICPDGVIFEGMFNWDVILTDTTWGQCDCNEETITLNGCVCELNKQFRKNYELTDENHSLDFGEVYCNIQPLLGDDYTYILRKMKGQIELTENYTKNEKDESVEYFKNKYVLIIKEFISTTTTIQQLRTIFRTSDIQIIIIDEIFLDCEEIQKLNKTQQNEFWGRHLLKK